MTPEQVEKQIIELKHHDPFAPFVVELADGQSLQLMDTGIAIGGGGATFFGPDGALVDFEFKTVRAIRVLKGEAVS